MGQYPEARSLSEMANIPCLPNWSPTATNQSNVEPQYLDVGSTSLTESSTEDYRNAESARVGNIPASQALRETTVFSRSSIALSNQIYCSSSAPLSSSGNHFVPIHNSATHPTHQFATASTQNSELQSTLDHDGEMLSGGVAPSGQPVVHQCPVNRVSFETQSESLWRKFATDSASGGEINIEGRTAYKASLSLSSAGPAISSTSKTQTIKAFTSDSPSSLKELPFSSLSASELPEETDARASTVLPRTLQQPLQKRGLNPVGAHAEPARQKQKLNNNSVHPSLEQLGDIIAASGVSVEDKERQLLSTAVLKRNLFRNQVKDRLFLQERPLHEKVMSAAKTWGISVVKEDVEICLSVSCKEWLLSILNKLINFSDQRRDVAKRNQSFVVTSDTRAQIRLLRQKAREESETRVARQKQAENLAKEREKGEEQSEPKSKSQKVPKNKKKEKETAVKQNASYPRKVEEMLTKWEIMAEQGRLKRGIEGGTQEQKQIRGQKQSKLVADSGRPPGLEGQTTAGEPLKPITASDLISVLEMDTRVAKSTLLYRFYEGARTKSS